MKNARPLLLLVLIACLAVTLRAGDRPPAPLAFDKLRFLPLQGHEKDVLGARILGSNVSEEEGFVELGEIRTVPAPGEWGELRLSSATPYRWIKYLAAPGTYGRVTKLEFYAGDQKLKANDLTSGYERDGWRNSLKDGPGGSHQSPRPDNQYVVIDTGTAATGPSPEFLPRQTESKGPLQVALRSDIPGAVLRYTLDGTIPTPGNSHVYSGPLTLDRTTTLEVSAFAKGRAPTPPAYATYIIGDPVRRTTFHIGNSLTAITGPFDTQARTAGSIHHSDRYLLGAGLTKALWHAAMDPIGDPADKEGWIALYTTHLGDTISYSRSQIEATADQWKKLWPTVGRIDDFTLQPRDFDLAEETDYDHRFLSLVLQKAPAVQPWLYIEWDERDRRRPTDQGKEPTREMRTVYPALTWEESMSAMILYGEDLKSRVDETYKGAKPIRIIPAALAVGWMHRMLDEGRIPGLTPADFYGKLFNDKVHLSPEGAYLVDCMFYAAFYGESPEGKFLPVRTRLTGPQALVMQRLAWDTMKNYPLSGLYQEGSTPAGKPQFLPKGRVGREGVPVSLASDTPGAWFRYTLDGTTPTGTRGYVYCGVISARPRMTIKAIAYKSGMADSPVSEWTCVGARSGP